MADENEAAKEGGEEKKSGLGTGAIIGIIGGALLLQALVVVFALKWVVGGDEGDGSAKTEQTSKHDDESHDEDSEESADSFDEDEDGPRHTLTVKHVVPLEDIIVNPRDKAGQFIVAGIGLEFADAEQAAALDKVLIPVRTLISRKFASMTVAELSSVEKRDSLSKSLRRELAPYFGETRLYQVYISKFLIQ